MSRLKPDSKIKDLVNQWMFKCCELKTEMMTRSSELHRSFQTWCDERKVYCTSQVLFSASLSEQGFQKKQSNGVHFMGIQLKNKIGGIG